MHTCSNYTGSREVRANNPRLSFQRRLESRKGKVSNGFHVEEHTRFFASILIYMKKGIIVIAQNDNTDENLLIIIEELFVQAAVI